MQLPEHIFATYRNGIGTGSVALSGGPSAQGPTAESNQQCECLSPCGPAIQRDATLSQFFIKPLLPGLNLRRIREVLIGLTNLSFLGATGMNIVSIDTRQRLLSFEHIVAPL